MNPGSNTSVNWQEAREIWGRKTCLIFGLIFLYAEFTKGKKILKCHSLKAQIENPLRSEASLSLLHQSTGGKEALGQWCINMTCLLVVKGSCCYECLSSRLIPVTMDEVVRLVTMAITCLSCHTRSEVPVGDKGRVPLSSVKGEPLSKLVSLN